MNEAAKPDFRFRLNGVIIPEILIRPEMLNRAPTGNWHIAVNDWTIGSFTIDNNENLWDKDLPKFMLEFRNETAWALTPVTDRCTSKDQGWKKVTTQELLAVLQAAGIIRCE